MLSSPVFYKYIAGPAVTQQSTIIVCISSHQKKINKIEKKYIDFSFSSRLLLMFLFDVQIHKLNINNRTYISSKAKATLFCYVVYGMKKIFTLFFIAEIIFTIAFLYIRRHGYEMFYMRIFEETLKMLHVLYYLLLSTVVSLSYIYLGMNELECFTKIPLISIFYDCQTAHHIHCSSNVFCMRLMCWLCRTHKKKTPKIRFSRKFSNECKTVKRYKRVKPEMYNNER